MPASFQYEVDDTVEIDNDENSKDKADDIYPEETSRDKKLK